MKPNSSSVFGVLKTVRVVLLVSGLIAVAIALAILFASDGFYAGYGIDAASNPTLANELKAPAGALLLSGLLMLAGVFRAELALLSLTIASLVYLSYGLSRIISFAVDGMPHSGMIGAAGIEVFIGAVCLITLFFARRAGGRRVSGGVDNA